jgi:hypothetical protein
LGPSEAGIPPFCTTLLAFALLPQARSPARA